MLKVVNTVFRQELSCSENQTNFHFPLINSVMGFLLIKFQENETPRKFCSMLCSLCEAVLNKVHNIFCSVSMCTYNPYHRFTEWFGSKGPKRSSSSLLWAGTPSARPCCRNPHLTWHILLQLHFLLHPNVKYTASTYCVYMKWF